MPRPANDLTGQHFGRLTVVSRTENTAAGKARWNVLCACGTAKVCTAADLRRGSARSCGCLQREGAAARQTSHGMSAHPAYAVWASMKRRCNDPAHPAWANYGGRGIQVCNAWDSFPQFWADMRSTYASGLTLDRVDNDAGYCPSNCRWATNTVQNNNRRGTLVLNTPVGPMTVSEAAQRYGLSRSTLHYRYNAGAPPEALVRTPDTASTLA